MDLYRILAERAAKDGAFISLTGGGGKTTLMVKLASYLRNAGKRVLITTTTRLMSPRFHNYMTDGFFCDDSVLSFIPDGPCAVLYGIEAEDKNKISCPPVENLKALRSRYDVIINEADGSKRLPLKVHTSRDPVIPPFTTYTISVMGLWGIGKKTADAAFGESRNLVVDESYLQWYLDNGECLLKGSLPGHRAIVFNGAENFENTTILRNLKYPDDVYECTASEQRGELYEQIQ